MQEVQTFMRRVVPPPAGVRTVWMFGFQRRLVRRCEWDTLWPKPGPLPQTSHTLATGVLLVGRRVAPIASGNLARVPDGPAPRRLGPTRLCERAGPPRRRRRATLVRGEPRRAAPPPARDRRAERLPGPRRRHRHQPGA